MAIVSAAAERHVPCFALLHAAWIDHRRAEFHLLNRDIGLRTLAALIEFQTRFGARPTTLRFDTERIRDRPNI